MLISTIICTHNRADILKICLEHIAQQTANKNSFEVIIINNNSTDHTEKVSFDFINKIGQELNLRYFYEGKPGLSAARNRGILESHGEYLNFIDDDALIPMGYISSLMKCISQINPKMVAGIGGKIIPKYFVQEPKWMSYYTWGLVSKHDLGTRPIKYTRIGQYPTGCNMTYKKSILQEVGLFDEALLRRCDDKYIAYEIKKKGYDIWYFPEVYLEHFIDEERISNRLPAICKDTGFHERLRLRNKGVFFILLKWVEYVLKLGASLILFIIFLFKGQMYKGVILVKMRWWFLKGYIY